MKAFLAFWLMDFAKLEVMAWFSFRLTTLSTGTGAASFNSDDSLILLKRLSEANDQHTLTEVIDLCKVACTSKPTPKSWLKIGVIHLTEKHKSYLTTEQSNIHRVRMTQSSSNEHTEKIPVYCICRLLNDGDPMIHRFKCTEWFHKDCVRPQKKYFCIRKLTWCCNQ